MKGVVAAGHPITADAAAAVLAEGGNAVDAAVAAVLTSFVTEPLLTGPGAGGFMLCNSAAGESSLLDFFVCAPGEAAGGRSFGALEPVSVAFSDAAVQVFNVGAPSCGVYGTCAGLERALERFGTATLSDLCPQPARLAREGVEITPLQAYLQQVLEPILLATPQARSVFLPEGRRLRQGERLKLGDLADLLERLGAEGPGFLYTGDVAAAVSEWVLERGGLITPQDLAGYEVIETKPLAASFRDRVVLTNPPPSSGGILIVYALELLQRLDRPADIEALVEVMHAANTERDADFFAGLFEPGFSRRFLGGDALARAASRLGSTTHISVLDSTGACASVTCSNGSGSGVVVPNTGVHLNNMLGEADLNPFGFHRLSPRQRVPSMMAPTVVCDADGPRLVLGSGGSNRIRSAILQTILNYMDRRLAVAEAVESPRLHCEQGLVDAEPGVDDQALSRLEKSGWRVRRWGQRNLFFGGVHACARDETGSLTAAGDPRRGGSHAWV